MKDNEVDVLLVGGGIMSATLGVLLHKLNPDLTITMIEQLSDVALESSDALNNAGTGHAGYCELNYTPEKDNRTVDIERALDINAGFETSLQFWASLVSLGVLPSAQTFINKTPHISLVWGYENIEFLRQRFLQLKQHHLFKEMQFSEDFAQLTEWMPLVMQDRDQKTRVAATYVGHGSDVDFGAVTRHMVAYLKRQANFTLLTDTTVKQLNRTIDQQWQVELLNTASRETKSLSAKFVFLGAGGGVLPLLQKANIEEAQGYGGFPVSGQWLICNKPEVVNQHASKVYGKAAVDAPPMSVPHLDTRVINGQKALLFGPFAGFTTKFLKTGSTLDLAKSIKINNIKPMLGVGKNNIDLTKYLIKEASQTHDQRMDTLRTFLPKAINSEWSLEQAGQRVQIIKACNEHWGKLEFGTEIISIKDGSLAAILGASPGASVSVKAMVNVIEQCFIGQSQLKLGKDWQQKLKQLIPAYGESLVDDAALLRNVRKQSHQVLNLY